MTYTEAIIVALVATVAACFGIQLILSRPDLVGIAAGLVPRLLVQTFGAWFGVLA